MTIIEHFSSLLHLTSEGLLIFLIHCIIFVGILLLRFHFSQFSGKINIICSSKFFHWSSKAELQNASYKENAQTVGLIQKEDVQDVEDNFCFSRSQSFKNLLRNCFDNKSKKRRLFREDNLPLSPQLSISKIYKNQNNFEIHQVYDTPTLEDDFYKHPVNILPKKFYFKPEIEHSIIKGFVENKQNYLKDKNCNFNDYQNFNLSFCPNVDANVDLVKCPGATNPFLIKSSNENYESTLLVDEIEAAHQDSISVDIQPRKISCGRNAFGKLSFTGCICELLGYSRCTAEGEIDIQNCLSKELLERKINSENNSVRQFSFSEDEIPSTSSSPTPEDESILSASLNEDFSLNTPSQASNGSTEKRFDSGLDSSFIYESNDQTVIILQMKEHVSLIHSRKTSAIHPVSNGNNKESQINFLRQIRSLLEKTVRLRRFSIQTTSKPKASLSNFIRNHRRHSSPMVPATKSTQYKALETLLTKMRDSGKFRLL